MTLAPVAVKLKAMSRRIDTPPKVFALVPCESAVKSDDGRWTINGAHHGLVLPKFPTAVREIGIYLALGKGSGEKETVNLAVLSPAGDVVGMSIVQIQWGPEATISDHYVTPGPIILREPGTYTIRVFVEGLVLMERTISVSQG